MIMAVYHYFDSSHSTHDEPVKLFGHQDYQSTV